jgi:RNA polymerase sigma factor (sigma-70 family)
MADEERMNTDSISRDYKLLCDNLDGSLKALDRIVSYYYDELSVYIRNFLKSRGVAKPENMVGDILHDTWIHFLAKRQEIEDHKDGLRPYLFKTARYKALDALKRRDKGERVRPEDIADDHSKQTGNQLANMSLDFAVLSEKELEVVNQMFFEGERKPLIAARMGISVATLYRMRNSALEKLRKTAAI